MIQFDKKARLLLIIREISLDNFSDKTPVALNHEKYVRITSFINSCMIVIYKFVDTKGVIEDIFKKAQNYKSTEFIFNCCDLLMIMI